MRRITLILASTLLVGSFAAAFSGCTSLLGDFTVAPAGDGGAAGKGELGKACSAAGDCASGFCADGVCCESSCSGACESCALATKGKCLPHGAGTDPEKECLPAPRPDAGIEPGPVDAGPVDAGPDATGSAGDSGSTTIAVPDGGLTQSDELCAGSCDGNRACKYPSTDTFCGTKFCSSSTEAARFKCDGKGNCDLTTNTCAAFVCEGEGCRQACASQDDCQATHFCNSSGKCQEKLGNGVSCTSPTDCVSGFCVVEAGSGVCCNADCGKIPGGSCKQPANVGKCKCSIDCGTGSCRLFFRDADKDGYGDKTGTVANTNAQVGCDNALAPTGFVADNTDCADNDLRARPGQSLYFDTPITGGTSYDFNCNGSVDKETDEYPGVTCHFCGAPSKCPSQLTCSVANDSAYLSCALQRALCLPPSTNCYTCGGVGLNKLNSGFLANVACGATGTLTTCGKCTFKGGSPTGTTTASKVQRCR